MTNRLFISAEIPEEIKENIIEIITEVCEIENSSKWESKNKYHITLKFLGDVEEIDINSIDFNLEKIITSFNRINCSFTKFGIFRKGNIPSVLWLGIKADSSLEKIAEKINNDFVALGFKKDIRKFQPHLTIKRLKYNERINEIDNLLNSKLPEINFTIEKISLMKSELLKSGSVYTKLKVYELN